MWNLTPESVTILESLARECSREGEEAETIKTFIDGFSTYSEEAINILAQAKPPRIYDSWEEFYRDRYQLLLENIGFAGQTFEQVFSSNKDCDWLCTLVRGAGASEFEAEDIAQEISSKIWQGEWIEGYNPLVTSWRNFLLVPIRNSIRTHNKRKSTKVTTGAFSLDREDAGDKHGRAAASCLYDLGQDELPEDDLIVQEIMEDWNDYLRSLKPIRTVVRHDFDKMCTLLPPGVPEIPITVEKNIFFLQGGHYKSRVTTRELYDIGICPMIPNQQLVDYISEDPVTRAQYIDSDTGDFVIQKEFPNPHYDPSVAIKEERTWMGFYDLIMQGLQIDEIAQALKMAPPSVQGRIKKLESMFREFWLVSTKIPVKGKILAARTYRCPNRRCRRLDMDRREECRVCGTDMRSEVAKMRFNAYPWRKVRVTRKTHDKFEKKKNKKQNLFVKMGSLSVMS